MSDKVNVSNPVILFDLFKALAYQMPQMHVGTFTEILEFTCTSTLRLLPLVLTFCQSVNYSCKKNDCETARFKHCLKKMCLPYLS